MPSPDELLERLIARLQRVRGTLTDEEFANLVADVTAMAETFEKIDRRARDRSDRTARGGHGR